MFYYKNRNYSFSFDNYSKLFLLCQVFNMGNSYMTKKELAERINVDPKTLKNWETSKPELLKLIYLGLASEKHIEQTEQYIQTIKEFHESK